MNGSSKNGSKHREMSSYSSLIITRRREKKLEKGTHMKRNENKNNQSMIRRSVDSHQFYISMDDGLFMQRVYPIYKLVRDLKYCIGYRIRNEKSLR